jgi:hypothetical protein
MGFENEALFDYNACTYKEGVMGWKKFVATWIVAIGVGFYTTFVLQSLWNWFAVTTFHLSEISYWTMYGMFMLVHALMPNNAPVDEERFNRLGLILNACVPDEKRPELEAEVEMDERSAPIMIATVVGTKVAENTLTLGLGWAVHTFLA